MRKENVVYDKAKKFAIRIIRFKQWLSLECKEYALADQILRSGTSIGANISESVDAVSKKDFRNKLSIALKECSETKYWLEIIHEAAIINDELFKSLYNDCSEIYAILSSIVKTLVTQK
ncbi:MAG: four helix bundle protein [Bacteroides sp.]|nr:four helix bundle protein [Bacteroides sp.]MCM1390537.1 four helix bundle protein [Bacteroides sp.]